MPIYEFECEACRQRFEELVPAGTANAECRHCSSERTRRVLSAPAARMHLVKTPRQNRKQERKNAQLRERTKADFKRKRQAARDRAKGSGS